MIRLGRSVIAGALLFSALIFSGVRRAQAQASDPDASPDIGMLLHLDLFESSPHDASGTETPGASSSMLNQIRTLDAMGYLGGPPGGDGTAGMSPAAASDLPRRPPPVGSSNQGAPPAGIPSEEQPAPSEQIE